MALRRTIFALGTALLMQSTVAAQPYVPPAGAAPPGYAPAGYSPYAPGYGMGDTAPVSMEPAAKGCLPSGWVHGDFILWRLKDGPMPIPLVTTNDAGTIGALMEPGTRVLFGAGANNVLEYGAFPGVRLAGGLWLDRNETFGLEGSGFALERRGADFAAASAGGLAPIVSIPFNATEPFGFNPAGESSLNAGNVPNLVTVSAPIRFWGFDANAALTGWRGDCYSVTMLAGGRYLNLRESLELTDNFTVDTGRIIVADSFDTTNEFYGMQIGSRAAVNCGRLSTSATLKLAVGTVRETLTINGNTVVTPGATGFVPGTTTGGVFAQQSNIGSYQSESLAVVPELLFDAGFALNNHIRLVGGYNFLCVTNVLRPGDNMNRNINPTQNTFFGGGNPTGAAAPLVNLRESSFWAQGVNLGVDIRW